jgi:hypothetical protein
MPIKRILKPALVVTLAAFLFSTAGFGQVRQHDLSVQFGFISIDQFADIFENFLTVIITLGNFYKEDTTYGAVPFLTYHHSANGRFGFGGAVGYYTSKGNLVREGGDVVAGDFKETNVIAAAELDYHWIMRPAFQLYSGAGFGLRIRRGNYADGIETATTTKALPTFHLNALGVRFGRKVGFFAECGVGYKGVLAAGINAQF